MERILIVVSVVALLTSGACVSSRTHGLNHVSTGAPTSDSSKPNIGIKSLFSKERKLNVSSYVNTFVIPVLVESQEKIEKAHERFEKLSSNFSDEFKQEHTELKIYLAKRAKEMQVQFSNSSGDFGPQQIQKFYFFLLRSQCFISDSLPIEPWNKEYSEYFSFDPATKAQAAVGTNTKRRFHWIRFVEQMEKLKNETRNCSGAYEQSYIKKLTIYASLFPEFALLPTWRDIEVDAFNESFLYPVAYVGLADSHQFFDNEWFEPATFFQHDLIHAGDLVFRFGLMHGKNRKYFRETSAIKGFFKNEDILYPQMPKKELDRATIERSFSNTEDFYRTVLEAFVEGEGYTLSDGMVLSLADGERLKFCVSDHRGVFDGERLRRETRKPNGSYQS